jgi:hypothetical protein
VVLPAKDHDRNGCFADQVKLTRALVRDLDEAVEEIKQLSEHGEESSWKIIELEALCKKKEDAAKKLKVEKAKLEGMTQSHDEMIMEMADEYGLNRMGENDEEEDGDDNRGDIVAPPVATLPVATPEVIIINEEEHPVEMISEQEVPEELEIIALEAEPKPPQPCLYTMLMRDYEECPTRMMDDLNK